VALGAVGGLAGARLRRREAARGHGTRRLAQRAMRDEGQLRRRVAEAIHDGPVQELIALDMVLALLARRSREEISSAAASCSAGLAR